MGYIFNRTNLLVAIVFTLSISLGANELIRWTKKVKAQNQQAFIEWQQRSKSRFKSQIECQEATLTICNYENCDFVPLGKTFEEVCGEGFAKGWKPSSVPIPVAFQYLSAIRLSIRKGSSEHLLSISPETLKISYLTTVGAASGEKAIKPQDITLLANKFILYDFPQLAGRLQDKPQTEEVVYTLSVISDNISKTETMSAACEATACPRVFIDLKNDIVRLWGQLLTDPA